MPTTQVTVRVIAEADDLWTAVTALKEAADADDQRGRLTTKASSLRRVADVIESQLPVPRPPQPGHLGMVEASCVHSDLRGTWVRVARGWVRIEAEGVTNPKYEEDDWDSLVDPVAVKR